MECGDICFPTYFEPTENNIVFLKLIEQDNLSVK